MRKKHLNGKKRFEARLRPVFARTRDRVVRFAKRHGSVTSAQAADILGVEQPYYHLRELAAQGLLEHAGWNLWKVAKRRKNASSEL